MTYRPRVTLSDIALRHRWRIQSRRVVRRGGDQLARARRKQTNPLS
ncbi:MAG: hypothetical protein KF812_02210 [Fimbriimonadaceae bacterium]|nr:hypothetical protein [Fimbriimonadaceae bacterium]